jgi:hypothetical protein
MAVRPLPRFRVTRERKHRPWDAPYQAPLWWSIYLKHADGSESYITRYRRWRDALDHVNKAIEKFGDH